MSEFPTSASIFDPALNKPGIDVRAAMMEWYAANGQLPAAKPTTTFMITDDALAPTCADILVDTEGQAPADNLQVIAIGGTHDGMRLFMRAASSARVVTVKHQPSVVYGITLIDGKDKVLSTTEELVLKREGNVWREMRAEGSTGTLTIDKGGTGASTIPGIWETLISPGGNRSPVLIPTFDANSANAGYANMAQLWAALGLGSNQGVVPVSSGGTEATTIPGIWGKLTSPGGNRTPMYIPTFGVSYADAGYTSMAALRAAMNLGSTLDVLAIDKGGTSASTAAGALANLGGTPRPNGTSGSIGYLTYQTAYSADLYLPSGGAWAYWGGRAAEGLGYWSIGSTVASIAAGGTRILAAHASGVAAIMWRIA